MAFRWPDGSPPRPVRGPVPRDRRVLELHEVLILRRLAQRQKSAAIARELGYGPDYVGRIRRDLRTAFGVDSDAELLALPEVRGQL